MRASREQSTTCAAALREACGTLPATLCLVDHVDVNWDALGAAGEILGAAAVVITLLYLVRQLKHAESSSQSSATDRVLQRFDDLNRLVVTDANLRGVLIKEGGLTPSEEEQLYTFAMMYCNIWLSVQTAYDNGQISEDFYAGASEDVRIELQRWPNMRRGVELWLARYPQVAGFAIFAPVRAPAVGE